MIIAIVYTAYLVCGIIFMVLSEDSQPEKIKNNKALQIIMGVISLAFWLPWLLINACFSKRDIWFRIKTDYD